MQKSSVMIGFLGEQLLELSSTNLNFVLSIRASDCVSTTIDKRMVMNGSNDVSVDDGILQFVQHLLETFHARDWAKVEHVINSNPESFRAISTTASKMMQLNQMTM